MPLLGLRSPKVALVIDAESLEKFQRIAKLRLHARLRRFVARLQAHFAV